MSGTFTKHPSETYPIGIDYASAAPTGATLASGVWVATNENDQTDATSTVLLNPTATIAGSVAKARVQSGTNGVNYRLSLTATFDTGDVLHDDVFMYVTTNE